MLKTLRIDNVKIDKSFIDGVAEKLEGKAIVKAVIAMCKELGLLVTAEGVEVEEQFSYKSSTAAQGYLMSRPLTAEKMTALISAATTVSSE